MAVNHNDNLQREMPDISTNKRTSIWMWFFINSKYQTQLKNCEINSPGMRNQIAEAIKNNPRIANEIKAFKSLCLLSETAIEWINDDYRQRIYIQKSIIMKVNYILPTTDNLTNREVSIATIDTLILTHGANEKLALVNEIRQSWENTKKTDKAFEWFDGSDEEQKTQTAWQIIGKKHPEITSQHLPPKTKNELLITLDFSTLTHPEKILLIDSIKKRWSQNKYRAKQNGKNQYNFILSDRAINRLDKLVEMHEIKRTEVLEILLKMESENGAYIPKHLNRLGDL